MVVVPKSSYISIGGRSELSVSEGSVTPPLPLDCFVVPPRNDSVAVQRRFEHLAFGPSVPQLAGTLCMLSNS